MDNEPDDNLNDELDDDLELEPVDPDILEHERLRTQRKIRDVEDRVDIDELVAPETQVDPYSFDDLKKFRFSIRHLMIATAVCALLLTLYIRLEGYMTMLVGGCAALGVGWWLVLRKERQQTLARQKLTEQMKERIAAQRAAEDGKPLEPNQLAQAASDIRAMDAKPAFSFSFSMQQLMATFAIVAVALGLSQWLAGGLENAALLLGFIALAGLALHALGVELPPIIVLGWWMLLVLYLFIGLIAAVTKSNKTAQMPMNHQELLLVDREIVVPILDKPI